MNRYVRKAFPDRSPVVNNLLLWCAAIVAFFSSCNTTKNSYYFKTIPRDTTFKATVPPPAESKIRKGDLLSINVSSLNKEEDGIYNAAAAGSGQLVAGSSGGGSSSGFLVDVFGNIQYHRLGIMKVEGMTRRELRDKLQKDLQPYLRDVIVTVRYMNHKVSILGEIAKPQVIQMPEENMTVLDVLAGSGDVTQTARRDNILVIREKDNGEKQMKRLNLENHSLFNSEWYYLQPNDVVYIEPNDKRIKEENRNRQLQYISLGLAGVSTVIIILDRIFR
jgi:polysaccharide export outer membrane protein